MCAAGVATVALVSSPPPCQRLRNQCKQHTHTHTTPPAPPCPPQTTASVCPRAAMYVDPSGTASGPISLGTTAFSGNNIRSVYIADAAGSLIITGSGTNPCLGFVSAGGGTTTALLASCVVPRFATVFGGSLIFSSTTTPTGVYLLGTAGAWSSNTGQTATAILAASGSYPAVNSPQQFVFQDAATLWICDDGSATSYGVWKLTGTLGTFSGALRSVSLSLGRDVFTPRGCCCSRVERCRRQAISWRHVCWHRRPV